MIVLCHGRLVVVVVFSKPEHAQCATGVDRTGAGKSPLTENASHVAPSRCLGALGKHLPSPDTNSASDYRSALAIKT